MYTENLQNEIDEATDFIATYVADEYDGEPEEALRFLSSSWNVFKMIRGYEDETECYVVFDYDDDDILLPAIENCKFLVGEW